MRRAWFLYEAITGTLLDLPDLRQGNYVPLLDAQVHVAGPVRKHRRQRIDVNLLGTVAFSPSLRWTPSLREVSGAALRARIDVLVSSYDEHTIRRAISYLYTRETMASFEIERERPPRDRAERFIALLREAPTILTLDEQTYIGLHKAIVDERFADPSWREDQNYVAESVDLIRQRVHYVCPRPADVEALMAGHLEMTRALVRCREVDPVLVAAVVSFAFVLIHPFTDGNGRIHRWLIHWVLSRSAVTPDDLVIPVSAVMLTHRRAYDEALETFSTRLMGLVSFDLDDEGHMDVYGDTIDAYRHPDLTAMAEALWRWLELAVDRELPDQLRFLLGFDAARQELQDIVDMPDKLVTLFIQLCHAQGGRLSTRKRERHFSMLTDQEVAAMEEVVARHFGGS